MIEEGFSQQEGNEHTKTFSPITKMKYVQLILSLGAHFRWEVYQMDVKSVFTQGDLIEEIYMEQLVGFKKYGSLFYQSNKSLHGLKQAPRAWYVKIDHFFCSLGFNFHAFDHSIYILHVNGENLIVAILCL